MAYDPPQGYARSLSDQSNYKDPFGDDGASQHYPAPVGNPAYAVSDVSLVSKEYHDTEHEAPDAFDESRPLTSLHVSYPPQQFVSIFLFHINMSIHNSILSLTGSGLADMGIRMQLVLPEMPQMLHGRHGKPSDEERQGE